MYSVGRKSRLRGGWLVAVLALTSAPVLAGLELDQARQDLAAGNFVEAESRFREALNTEPESVELHLGLARALEGQGKGEAAVGILLNQSERLLRTADYQNARALLEEALDVDPESALIRATLGRTLALDRQYSAAEPHLQQAFDRGSADLRTTLYLGSTLWENGRTREAEDVFRQALLLSGRSCVAVHQLGRLLVWLSRFEEGAGLLAECSASAGQADVSGDLELDLARALAGTDNRKATLAAYRRATELLPEHSEARYGLAMALLESGDRAGAQEELEAYRRLNREDQDRIRRQGLERARIDRGRDLLRAGKIAESIAHFENLEPTADTLSALATALRIDDQLDRAVDVLLRASSLAPERQDLRALVNEIRLEQIEKQ